MSKGVLSDFKFLNNRVLSMSIKNSIFSLGDEPLECALRNIDYNVTKIDEIEDSRIGIITFSLEICAKTKAKKKTVFTMRLELEGAFATNKQCPVDEFTKNLELSGTSALISIARSIVIINSGLCMLDGQLRMPMISPIALYEHKHAKDNNESEQ